MAGVSAGPYSIGSGQWPGLAKVIEECGEVIQAAGKIIAANGDGRHWDGSDLRQRLEDELADAQAAIGFAIDMNGLDSERMLNRTADKLAMFAQWHLEHSDGSETVSFVDFVMAGGKPTDWEGDMPSPADWSEVKRRKHARNDS